MIIIYIAGKAGHGKSTFANIVKEELENINKRVLIINFVDLLKFQCRTYFGWDGE